MADGVLLDWEGVLADTADARRTALHAALAEEGIAVHDAGREERCAGWSVRAAAECLLGDRASDVTLVELVTLRAERAFAARLAHGFTIHPGAARFVERAQLRAPLVVVSAAGRSDTDTALRLTGLHDSCAAIVTADDVAGDAPSRASYELALTHLAARRSVRPERLVVLATTLPAIRAARAAAMRTVAIGAPAHVAIEADAALGSLDEVTVDALDALLGIGAERPA